MLLGSSHKQLHTTLYLDSNHDNLRLNHTQQTAQVANFRRSPHIAVVFKLLQGRGGLFPEIKAEGGS
jgi:hypothetical protein